MSSSSPEFLRSPEAETRPPGSAVDEAAALRIAIAGASGFIGGALARRLQDDCRVIALGRRYEATHDGLDPESGLEAGLVRRRCDLFSVGQTRDALEGASVAVYLVHSMSPNARLTQGRFEDLDLLLADNFGRAAARAGVERIVYLGGLVPDEDGAALSSHLASRLEVETALGAHGVPVTAVRAGLVVGEDGSSLRMLVKLVERLPLMICPSWTRSEMQPIALSDVVEILEYVCRHPDTAGRVCEIGGPEVLSYRKLMQVTARVLGRRRAMLPVPFVTPALSELWVATVTGTSRSLVRPLIGSLRHPMIVRDRWLQDRMGLEGRRFEDALRASLRGSRIWRRPIARSVQRLPLPPGRDVRWVGETYPTWLARALPWVLTTRREDDLLHIGLRGLRRPLLTLRADADAVVEGRFVFRVAGGMLAAPQPMGDPRLEFRRTPDGRQVLAVLQDFEPRLPWWLYVATQALIHRAVMHAYGRRLGRAVAADRAISVERDAGRSQETPRRGASSSPRDTR